MRRARGSVPGSPLIATLIAVCALAALAATRLERTLPPALNVTA